ncbi:MAG: hypothetical protein LUG12_07755 [Erysipelotrichaceae bacterium]|nr:hypothetical protein [Erysipelotrichaceae bacterium]
MDKQKRASVVSDVEKDIIYKDNRYFLTESLFKEQMQYLNDNNYTTLSMDEVYAYYIGESYFNEKTAILTFDD